MEEKIESTKTEYESYSHLQDEVTKALWDFYKENNIRLSLDDVLKRAQKTRENVLIKKKDEIIKLLQNYYNKDLPDKERYELIKIADIESYNKTFNSNF